MFKEGKLVPGMVLLSVNREGVKGMARDQIVNIIKVQQLSNIVIGSPKVNTMI